jgi:hypothetical protein
LKAKTKQKRQSNDFNYYQQSEVNWNEGDNDSDLDTDNDNDNEADNSNQQNSIIVNNIDKSALIGSSICSFILKNSFILSFYLNCTSSKMIFIR